MNEVLAVQRAAINSSDVLERLGLEESGYFLGSAHREENVDNPSRLSAMLDCLEAVVEGFKLPVLVSTHPRTKKRLEASGRDVAGVRFHRPLGFHDYNHLQLKARCVIHRLLRLRVSADALRRG